MQKFVPGFEPENSIFQNMDGRKGGHESDRDFFPLFHRVTLSERTSTQFRSDPPPTGTFAACTPATSKTFSITARRRSSSSFSAKKYARWSVSSVMKIIRRLLSRG